MTGVGSSRERLIEHRLTAGRCPVCDTPHRCWEWAAAFADLIAHGELPVATPPAPSGGNPTAGAPEGDPA